MRHGLVIEVSLYCDMILSHPYSKLIPLLSPIIFSDDLVLFKVKGKKKSDFDRTTLCVVCCVSSGLGALLGQQQVVESDDDVGKVGELHEVGGDDVDSVRAGPLSLHPGHDGGQVPVATAEEKFV